MNRTLDAIYTQQDKMSIDQAKCRVNITMLSAGTITAIAATPRAASLNCGAGLPVGRASLPAILPVGPAAVPAIRNM
jgi:hypothetical protein